MKDYSNIYPSPYERMKEDALLLFDKQLSIEGREYILDGEKHSLIVVESSNPLNDFKEERKVLCTLTTPIKRGSIIEDLSDSEKYWADTHDKYIVIADIDNNHVYIKTKALKANNVLKWQDENLKIIETPCYIQNFSLYTDGVQKTEAITVVDTKINIVLPLNEDTIKLKRNKRVLVTRGAYELTMFDDYSRPGIIALTLTETEESPNDRFDLGVADYVEPTIPQIPSVDEEYYTLYGEESIKKGNVATYTAKKVINDVEVDCQFDFEVIPGDTPLSKYNFKVLNDTQCSLESLDYVYYITLRAKDRLDNTKYVDKQIKLSSLF